MWGRFTLRNSDHCSCEGEVGNRGDQVGPTSLGSPARATRRWTGSPPGRRARAGQVALASLLCFLACPCAPASPSPRRWRSWPPAAPNPPAGTAPGERPFDIGDLAAAGAAEAALGRLAQPRDWVAAEARSGGLAAAHLAARADALEALAEYTRPRAQPGR
jgi:hypothetical protein